MRAQEFATDDVIARLKSGGINIGLSSHMFDRQEEQRVANRMLNLALSKLKTIKQQMGEFDPGESFWALDPTTQLSLGVRKLPGDDRYLVATLHHRRTFDTNDRPVIKMSPGDAVTREDLQELSFLGSECTQDCSGHRAGYNWYRLNRKDPQSWSPSFNKGAALARAGK